MKLLMLGGLQALAYLVLVVNMRAVAKMKYLPAAVTEIVYAGLNFLLIHRIVEARTWPEALAYITGCTVGTQCAMFVTKHWKD